MNIGVLYSRVRGDEKLIFAAIERAGHTLVRLNSEERAYWLDQGSLALGAEVVIDRCVSSTQALYISELLEKRGVLVVNRYEVIKTCENKLYTNLALEKAHVPTPKVRVAFSSASALQAIEEMGYPVVIKPTTGSWGRLLALVENRSAAEAVLEHKETLGTYHHSIFYIQKYVDKPGRDIRAFVVNGEAIRAIYRDSPHWITNTARGGRASNCPVTSEMADLCQCTSAAVGGGFLAMDIFETADGLVINEINHAMEFKNSELPTSVSISGAIVDYAVSVARMR